MNFNGNDLWRNKTELLNLRLTKLHITKVLLKLEFDTEDQVLFIHYSPLPPKFWLQNIILGGPSGWRETFLTCGWFVVSSADGRGQR